MSKLSTNPSYNAGLYASNNAWQRHMNLLVLELLERTFAPSNTECEQFLDLGCGTGDFTRNELLVRCPPCRRIVAVDASEEMLAYARENSAHSKIVFAHLNINDDVADFAAKYGTFSRIYSFFCLNWVKDQAKAMKNLASLLSPSGECLLIFPAWSSTRMLWRKLGRLERWRKYAKGMLMRPARGNVAADPGIGSVHKECGCGGATRLPLRQQPTLLHRL
ncbi:juvenile hormone acid O-methyltransferase-like [Dermacentor silvarum]|uniref:juvenile hormone acid O-methyltransferase-like n=1 Tax=Dermacentor silvarum TaxID=543639 RepID=UPI0018971755|nr:juvenile hormone acid O-methyltransferase-like [Dermacentor silvarum]